MPEFILFCHDRKDSLALRLKTRDEHLAYVASADVDILLAGPIFDGEDNPAGSLFVIAAAKKSDVQSFADNDPYALAGLFETVEIRPYRIVAGALAPK
ncbi:MAG: YciI family protein [Alphaproteobacteria bacterium]|nr:YciI family protein [Alphaproteobacteria bacterium]